MAPVAPQHLFPLPLTAFEDFMLADESSDFPMVFYLQVRLKGVVDRKLMKLAVDDALSRHPLLCCTVKKHTGKNCWSWAGAEIPETDWDESQWSEEKPWQQTIDLRKRIGLRVWGQQTPDHATLTLQFHHACCDGIGASQFLEDVAIAYARHYAVSTNDDRELPELRPIRVDLLKNRNDREGRRVADVGDTFIERARVLLKYTLRYLRQDKLPLRSKRDNFHNDRQQGLSLMTVQLSRQETRGLRDAARMLNASLNDLLVSELMVTSNAWNIDHGQSKNKSLLAWKHPTICVLVPTSLRGPSDTELPACNVVSYVFMARETSLVARRNDLICSIRDEMQLVHKHQAGWLFVQAIEALKKIPGMLRLIMWRTRNSCMSTTVLSHMGNLLNTIGSRLPKQDKQIRMGNLIVEDIAGIPPIRKGTAAAFSTILMNGCLSISMRCCADRFSQTEATALLDSFAATLKSTSAQAAKRSKTPVEAAEISVDR